MTQVKCFFCDNPAMPDLETVDPAMCIECAVVEEKSTACRKVWEARQVLNDSLKELTKLKFKGEPLRITNVVVFANGNTAVMDQFGDQMKEYQGLWQDVKFRIYAQVNQQDKKPMFHDAYGVNENEPG